MSAQPTSFPKPFVTVEQYLAMERVAIEKSEYYDGEMFLMAGASERHNLIATNAVAELRNHFRKFGCRVYGSDMRIFTKTSGLFSYADAVVLCAEPEFYDSEFDILTNPMLIVEVLSPATAKYDRTKKFALYKALPSFQDYLLIEQDLPAVEHWQKTPTGEWQSKSFSGLDETLRIERYDLAIPLSELYLNVNFPEQRR